MKQRYTSFLVLLLSLLFPALLPAQGLIIPSGGHVTATEGNVVLRSNWTNNGAFVHNGGTVIFAGTAQSVGGTTATTFRDMQVATGSTTTIIAPGQAIERTLLSNGTLNADGNLTLLSTATQSALIEGSGTGQVLGTVIMQRYLSSAFGYKYISAPFQAATVNELADDLDLQATFPSVYRFDEDLTSAGWVSHMNASDLLHPMQGYAANFGDAAPARTIDISGTVNNGTVSLTSLFNNNRTYTKGFQLVGNPYPSPIDWDAATGWSRTNIDNAVYYFDAGTTDQYQGTYNSYINGVSSNGTAGSIIPAMQGFFVHVSDGTYPVSGSLSVNNNARVSLLNPVFHKGTGGEELPLLRLQAGLDGQAVADPLVLYFEPQASHDFDKAYDALKILNTDARVPSLYALGADAAHLSIDAVPYNGDSLRIIPLGLAVEQAGTVRFRATALERMPADVRLYLYDAQSGTNTELLQDAAYRVPLEKGTFENRFFLAFGRKAAEIAKMSAAPFTAHASGGRLFADLNLLSGGKGELAVVNTMGQVVLRSTLNGYGRHELEAHWSSGIYIVSFAAPGGVHSQKIFIANP